MADKKDCMYYNLIIIPSNSLVGSPVYVNGNVTAGVDEKYDLPSQRNSSIQSDIIL